MIRPRYSAGSVTGYPISAATMGDGRPPGQGPRTLWYIHDRAYGYRVVRRVRAYNGRLPGRPSPHSAAEQAYELCARLNEQHDQWLRERGLL